MQTGRDRAIDQLAMVLIGEVPGLDSIEVYRIASLQYDKLLDHCINWLADECGELAEEYQHKVTAKEGIWHSITETAGILKD